MFRLSKSLLALVALPLLVSLTGCNSEGAFSERTEKLERIDIVGPTITGGSSDLKLAKGNKQPFEVVGHFADGSSRPFTDLSAFEWISSDPIVGGFYAPGELTGNEKGDTTVIAKKDGINSNEVKVTVTDAVIKAIQVTPATVQLAKGQTQQLTVTATYTDGTSYPVTGAVKWVSTDATMATVTPEGMLSGQELGETTITAEIDGINSNALNLKVTEAVIELIQVTPATVGLASGQSEQLTATAIYSDDTSSSVTNLVTWVSADAAIASVTAGVLKAENVGSTTVTATKDGISSNTVNVTNSDAVIAAIQVTPSTVDLAKGETEQLTATAIYSDGTSTTVTDSVVWVSSDSSKASVTKAGVLKGENVGSTTVIAKIDGISISSNAVKVTSTDAVIQKIQVSPAAVSVAKGQTQQLTATGLYSDGTSHSLTGLATWEAESTTTATVTPEGLLTGESVGTTTVTVTMDGVTSQLDVTVTDAVLTAIRLTPTTVDVAKGQTQQLTATATYSDGTSSPLTDLVTWVSDDAATATVTPEGLVTGESVGSTKITVTKNGISNTVNVTVKDAVITEIHVTPETVDVVKGQTLQLTATATYSDGTTSPIISGATWISNHSEIATVSPEGLLSGDGVGSTTVIVTKNGISSTVNVTVNEAVITGIQVTPSDVSVLWRTTQKLTVEVVYSDGSLGEAQNSVVWTSNDSAIATVTPTGELKGEKLGETFLTVTMNGFSTEVRVTVNDLAGPHIDLFDATGKGKLFTNSPSVAYLNSIGIDDSAATPPINDKLSEDGYEDGTSGPVGQFYLFDWNKSAALCDIYNEQNLGGRNNWRLAENEELKVELFGAFGDMFMARGWPTEQAYWSKTNVPGESTYKEDVNLANGGYWPSSMELTDYVTCVSEP
ncbi:Ig-like domain-containing protein [Vibrio owensii]|uniref:Ig-like domain-containing protein n=1 Tax=Vibrio owensii TaxID=696485 RepID=UPI003AAF35D6